MGDDITFEFDNNTPIYLQLIECLKIYIISGKLEPGKRIPSVRDLALLIKVNPNTVQKALEKLEEMKLIYTKRTNGKFVTEDFSLINKLKEEYADEITKIYFEKMQNIGFEKIDTMKYLDKERK